MTYVLAAIAALVWIGIFMGSVVLLVDTFDDGGLFDNPWHNVIVAISGLIFCIASALWLANQPEGKPCARYETTMQYNAALKTTMPMRYCAEYGEWVK